MIFPRQLIVLYYLCCNFQYFPYSTLPSLLRIKYIPYNSIGMNLEVNLELQQINVNHTTESNINLNQQLKIIYLVLRETICVEFLSVLIPLSQTNI